MPVASLITTCKGRLAHLRQTLPAMLAQSVLFDFEVVVVDYGCPDGVFEWCRAMIDKSEGASGPSLVAVRVLEGTDEFHRSRAKNCGARAAGGRVFAFVDADVRLGNAWLSAAAGPLLDGAAGLALAETSKRGWDTRGTCAIAADLFHEVRGYDEALTGWGQEDLDLYARCRAKRPVHRLDVSMLFPIHHNHADRTRFHAGKSLDATDGDNRRYLRGRAGSVNPQGYGRGKNDITAGHVNLPEAWLPVGRRRRGVRLWRARKS